MCYILPARNCIADVDKEIEICAQLKHSFLCELKDVIAGDKAVHMVFEFLDGDDICFEIVKRASAGFVYSEAVARYVIFTLITSRQSFQQSYTSITLNVYLILLRFHYLYHSVPIG